MSIKICFTSYASVLEAIKDSRVRVMYNDPKGKHYFKYYPFTRTISAFPTLSAGKYHDFDSFEKLKDTFPYLNHFSAEPAI